MTGREYAVRWIDPTGVARSLGRVIAPVAHAAAMQVCQAYPFLPLGAVHLTPLTPEPEPKRRGFHDPVTARRASARAHTPEAHAKRRATIDARLTAANAKPLTLGQRKWRDLARRRKRNNPRRATHDGG